MNENRNVLSLHDRHSAIDDTKTEKEIQQVARLARKMRRQETRLRDSIKKLEESGLHVGVRTGIAEPLPMSQVSIIILAK